MAKQKTHKGMAKRFRLSATGKVLHARAWKGHLMSHKSSRRRRRLSRPGQLQGADALRVRKALAAR